jgi:predicted DNA-binding transcriptional regulator YafY
MTLDVSNDPALRSWILGFGPLARVVSPPSLAAEIRRDVEKTLGMYQKLSQ